MSSESTLSSDTGPCTRGRRWLCAWYYFDFRHQGHTVRAELILSIVVKNHTYEYTNKLTAQRQFDDSISSSKTDSSQT